MQAMDVKTVALDTRVGAPRYSIYLLYWYTSTNTDASAMLSSSKETDWSPVALRAGSEAKWSFALPDPPAGETLTYADVC
jgi:hypothetical protein